MRHRKYCPECEHKRLRKFFYKNAARYDGLSNYCKKCETKRSYYDKKTDPKWVNKQRKRLISRARKLRKAAIAIYGGKCKCCGEDKFEFLTFDHINNNGAQHRKEIKKEMGGNNVIVSWLKKHNYPKGIVQILCWNCNCAKASYGKCPHKH